MVLRQAFVHASVKLAPRHRRVAFQGAAGLFESVFSALSWFFWSISVCTRALPSIGAVLRWGRGQRDRRRTGSLKVWLVDEHRRVPAVPREPEPG